MMIDNREISTNGVLSAKVSLHKAIKLLGVGESFVTNIERLAYARQVASVMNTTRGHKSIKIIPVPEDKVIKISRIG